MICVFSALLCEALPLFSRFGLKQVYDYPFSGGVSDDGQIRVIITGIGKTNAAAAVSFACAKYGITKNDFLVNIGTCAGGANRSGAYLINKVTDNDSGRNYYPDMLYKTGLPESEVTTVSTVATEEMVAAAPDMLWEMEASGFADSARLFVPPHRVQLIKAVSDSGAEKETDLTAEVLQGTIERSIDAIANAIEVYLNVSPAEAEEDSPEGIYDDDFKCSETMKHDLNKLMIYCKNSGRDAGGIITQMREEGIIPAPDRKRGKEALDEFKRRLLQ